MHFVGLEELCAGMVNVSRHAGNVHQFLLVHWDWSVAQMAHVSPSPLPAPRSRLARLVVFVVRMDCVAPAAAALMVARFNNHTIA